MANSQMTGNVYPVPSELQKFIGTTITYENLKMTKTRLNKAKDSQNIQDFNKKGGESVLNWIETTLKSNRDAIYGKKKVGMDTDRENQFIKPHEKDSSKNPTKVGGIPNFAKGDVSRKLMSDKMVYNESLKKELNQIKYLIEYINNNKQKI